MKPVNYFAFTILLLLAFRAAVAQSSADAPQNQQQAQVLLEKMLNAEKNLKISGEQDTILYRPEQTFTASQTIVRQGDTAMRIEYNSPQSVAGDVFVDNGKLSWHYIPSAAKLEVGISGLGRFRRESDNILRRLGSQQLTAEIMGQEVVAGQNAQVVQVTAQHSWGEHRYWIDPNTGAQLKIQTFGNLGQLVSQTYFTKITYRSKIDGSEFDPPKVDSSVKIVPMTPRGSQAIAGLPTSTDCGFQPLLPSYIPPGFAFQSTVIMPMRGQKLVGLTYGNALVSLSIFEKQIIPDAGQSSPHDEMSTPRQGVVTAIRNGYQYILVGSLPTDVMQRVVQSMR
jgi:negative regulator of sigma E activity